ncbi:MAG: tRNA (5-methylaminomethyl-2-thiouridine)(34)-methyltransferase MnmD [Bacteroidales bacterium]|nr:tRNA (5-methylaminomethyl-2-thiouridine)(34)-methyltransferase MnmD [Bacteroidales bacterium]
MQRSIIVTEDGSHSLYVPQFRQSYHSVHGALQESEHIFIQAGLACEHISSYPCLNIFEAGFGTGLNALLTWYHAQQQIINYHAIELYPLQEQEYGLLNYAQMLPCRESQQIFLRMHQAAWGEWQAITPCFNLYKSQTDLQEASLSENRFHLVYFDAFSPGEQPELWTEKIFAMLYNAMIPQGVLVTYSTMGVVKRALKSVGFVIEKLPGPKGKREILRAFK